MAWLRRVTHRVDRVDRSLTRRIGELPSSPADGALKTVTTSANHGLLWFMIAAVLASRRGATRRAAHGPPVALATDGEVLLHGNTFDFAIGPTRLVVYRP